MADKPVEYIDLTPTWSEVLPIFIACLENGTEKGKTSARAELLRMAKLADAYVAEHKKVKS
jgi:hypothetical protein